MGHFAASEAQRNFDLVAFADEVFHRAQFHLIIIFVDIGTNLDFFDFDDFLLLAGFVFLFLLLVFEFAIVELFTNRRLGIRADLDEVQPGFKGAAHRVSRT
jgi:hypothetical protein